MSCEYSANSSNLVEKAVKLWKDQNYTVEDKNIYHNHYQLYGWMTEKGRTVSAVFPWVKLRLPLYLNPSTINMVQMLFDMLWILLETQMQFRVQGRCSTEIY